MSQPQSQSQTHSSGSAGTGGTASSVETLPTQELHEGSYSDDEVGQISLWGRLLPLDNCAGIDLCKDVYTFGRAADKCDVALQMTNACFKAYSSTHFKIHRESTNMGIHVFLTDLSSNGTFINGEKVGKENRQALQNNDEIALAIKKNKVFVFMDVNANEDSDLPPEIRARYRISKELGRGACGVVKLAFEKGSCRKFAVKVITKKKFSVNNPAAVSNIKQVMSEVNILRSLKHPSIIGIEDVHDTKDFVFIVLELVKGGELFDKIVKLGQLSESLSKLYFYQILLAMKYLHDQEITHRDLKPENILLATENDETLVKVTDFGLSKFIDANTMLRTFCGTPNYLAPEILTTAGMGSYTKAIDCWSLGVILFVCLAGYPPFTDERKDMSLVKQITTGSYTFPKKYWNSISTQAIDLIKGFLTVKPEKRISINGALEHDWFNDDVMKTKAHNLMYPGSMPPPTILPRKRHCDSAAAGNANKRLAAATPPPPGRE